MGFADDSFHGPTIDLQIDNFLEWEPDHQGFAFIEVVQKEYLAMWFHIRKTWPVSGNDLNDALPTDFYVGPLGASLWCVGSAPGDCKGRPWLRTWLLVHLWDLNPGVSLRRGSKDALAPFGSRNSVNSHCLWEQSVRSSLWGENNQEITSQAGLHIGIDCSWISPDTGQKRSVFSAFQGPSVCRSGGYRLKGCVDAVKSIFSKFRSVFAA